jgi:hypothetical protein
VDRLPVSRVSATAAIVLLFSSCTSSEPCVKPTNDGGTCADLRFGGHSYDEWRPFTTPGILQELVHGDVDGHGATDVWRLEGVDPAQAVVGLREDSRTRVVFVRIGVDTVTLHPSER